MVSLGRRFGFGGLTPNLISVLRARAPWGSAWLVCPHVSVLCAHVPGYKQVNVREQGSAGAGEFGHISVFHDQGCRVVLMRRHRSKHTRYTGFCKYKAVFVCVRLCVDNTKVSVYVYKCIEVL